MLVGLVVVSGAYADDYRQQVAGQIELIKESWEAAGYRSSHNIYYDRMDDSEIDTHTFNLSEGLEYAISAACDNDCADIDSYLYDSAGNLIDSDEGPDDIPIVTHRATWTGRYTLKIKMYDCRETYCETGILVMKR